MLKWELWAARDVVTWWQGITAKRKPMAKRGQQVTPPQLLAQKALLKRWLRPQPATVADFLDDQLADDSESQGATLPSSPAAHTHAQPGQHNGGTDGSRPAKEKASRTDGGQPEGGHQAEAE